VKTSESIKEIAGALAKAQGVMAGAKKDADNPFFKSKYADLSSVWEACRPALTANGIAVVQMTRASERDEVIVITRLCHESGEWIEGELAMPVTKADAQGFGSAVTYARRYALAAAVGVAPADDDGNAAAAAKPKQMLTQPVKANVEGETMYKALTSDERAWYDDHAKKLNTLTAAAGAQYLEDQRLSDEDRLILWHILPSGVRNGIKAAQKDLRALAEQA
jgi:hypothetical protein